MLESLNMLSPSRLKGSICSSSSSGNGVSMSRLTSGMPDSPPLRPLNRLVLVSSVRIVFGKLPQLEYGFGLKWNELCGSRWLCCTKGTC